MDPTIFASVDAFMDWYPWWFPVGAIFALFLALGAVFWIFFDSGQRGLSAILWKIAAVLSVVLIIPSVILAIQVLLGTAFITGLEQSAALLAWLGIAGAIIALVSLVLYSLGLGVGSGTKTCPDCGRELDASWEHCPYCGPPGPTAVAPVHSPPPPPPPPLVDPILSPPPKVMDSPPIAEMSGADDTMLMFTEPPELAWLIQLSGMRTGKDYRLGATANIGREASQNDIVIDDPKIGRQHARIRLVDGEFVLHDLASLNKTFVNDEETLKHVLEDGDRIRFADVEFYFMRVEKPED